MNKIAIVYFSLMSIFIIYQVYDLLQIEVIRSFNLFGKISISAIYIGIGYAISFYLYKGIIKKRIKEE